LLPHADPRHPGIPRRFPWLRVVPGPFLVLLSITSAAALAAGPPESPPPEAPCRLVDVTAEAGIAFNHNSGAAGRKYLPETMGSGCAFLDYDNDGWLDLYFVNSRDWPESYEGPTYGALYRNRGDGTFEEVTKSAGLRIELYGMGCTVGDYDNDGDGDLYLSCLGPDRLFRNDGGRFNDVTGEAGLSNPDFGASCAWLDYDKDGWLDLFVTNYVDWSIETDLYCTLDGVNKSYCTPESYHGVTSRLFRNRGDGTFEEVTRPSGIFDPTSKALGVCVFDYDGNGWLDLAVANDTQPNQLFRNKGDGTFSNEALMAGIAFSETGVARGAMGIDAGDYDHQGRESLVVGNFSNEMMALYHNEGAGFFIDEAPTVTIGNASLLTLSFACFFVDFDLDGYLDVFSLNGHVETEIEAVQPKVTYAQPPHLFHNQGGKRFREITSEVGSDLGRPIVGRGAAAGDFDNDGDLDLALTTNDGPAFLYRNDVAGHPSWVGLRLEGRTSNRDAIGTTVRVTVGAETQVATVRTGSSYLSQSQTGLVFGLGDKERVDRVEIIWPSGERQVFENPPIRRYLRLVEGEEKFSASL
jgi:hypothetical protein